MLRNLFLSLLVGCCGITGFFPATAQECRLQVPDVVYAVLNETVTITAVDALGLVIPASQVQWSVAGAGVANPLKFKASKDVVIRVTYTNGSCRLTDSVQVFVKNRLLYYGGNDDGYARAGVNFHVAIEVPEEFCEYENLVFKASAKSEAGTASYHYTWKKIGHSGDFIVSEYPEFYLLPAKATDAGHYYCDVRDENGYTVRSDTQQLKLNPLTVSVQPRQIFAMEGEKVNFVAVGAMCDTLGGDSIKWSKNLKPLVGVEPPVYQVAAGNADMFVKVNYTNYKGCVAMDSGLVMVKAHRRFLGGVDDGYARAGGGFTVVIEKPLTKVKEFCAGNRIDFQATVPEGVDTSYVFRWWKVGNPVNILMAETRAFSLQSAKDADKGYYFCEALDINGFFAYSDTLLLSTHQVNLPEVMYAMEQDRLMLTAVDGGGLPIAAGNIKWYGKRQDSSSENVITPGGNPLNLAAWDKDMMIRAVCSFAGGCTASDSTRVYIRNNGLFVGGDDDGYDRTGTPPLIIKPYLPELFCTVADTASFMVAAIGSDLKYQWQIQQLHADWTDVEHWGYTGDDARVSLVGMPEEFHVRLRCKVWNRLDTVYSDTMNLYGHHLLSVSALPDVVRLYDNQRAEVVVKLENGVMPWTYYYQTPGNVNYRLNDLRVTSNTFQVREAGIYRITYLKDSLGCEVRDSLPEVKVVTPQVPVVTISGDREICMGEEIRLWLEVENGLGPWKIKIAGNGQVVDSVMLHRRDTTIVLPGYESAVYTVAWIEDLNEGKQTVVGQVAGSARIVVNEPARIRFAVLADNHIGICKPVPLFEKLRPHVDGVEQTLADGRFYLNGRDIGDKWNVPDMMAGEYGLEFRQNGNVYTCSGRTEVNLVVDANPLATMNLPDFICENDTTSLTVGITGNGVRFGLGQKRVSLLAGAVDQKRMVDMASFGQVYRETVQFIAEDSCVIYTVDDVEDKHGCGPASFAVLSDTVYKRLLPEVSLESRYPDIDGEGWKVLPDTIWTYGDGVGIFAGLSKGIDPYRLLSNGQRVADNENPVFSLSGEGNYTFDVIDKYCSSADVAKLTICYLHPLYVRLKILLENQPVRYDSLVVTLRNASGNICAVDTCSVLPDGTVLDKTGNSLLSFCAEELRRGDAYRICIGGKDYLGIQSKNNYVLSETGNSAKLIDFTDGNMIYTVDGDLSRHMSQVGEQDGKIVWALSAVDANANALITVKDVNKLKINNLRIGDNGMTEKNRDKFMETDRN